MTDSRRDGERNKEKGGKSAAKICVAVYCEHFIVIHRSFISTEVFLWGFRKYTLTCVFKLTVSFNVRKFQARMRLVVMLF